MGVAFSTTVMGVGASGEGCGMGVGEGGTGREVGEGSTGMAVGVGNPKGPQASTTIINTKRAGKRILAIMVQLSRQIWQNLADQI